MTTRILLPVLMLTTGFSFAQDKKPEPRKMPPVLPKKVDKKKVIKLAPTEQARVDLFNKVRVSVVHVSRLTGALSLRSDPHAGLTGVGSGIVWDDAGHILTNYHIVGRDRTVDVKLSDGSSYRATVLKVSPTHNLALLKITADKKKLKPIGIGVSADLQTGQTVYAVGNPFGKDETLAKGMIMAMNRETRDLRGNNIEKLIQTDAPLTSGTSGGPMVDSAGRLIGLSMTVTRGPSRFGFAMPVDEIAKLIPELLKPGETKPGKLGIIPHSDVLTQRLNLKGVLIDQLLRRGPADDANLVPTRATFRGLTLGDLIQEVDGKPVENNEALRAVMKTKKSGEKVKLTLLRLNKKVIVEVTLE